MAFQLLTAQVGHTRHQPKRNSFLYNVFYIAIPVTREPSSLHPGFFSWNHFNVFSLYTRDHGAKTNKDSWYHWIKKELSKGDFSLDEGDIVTLICHPRLLGYGFNPISYWLLQNKNGGLRAVLCEVNNTFGDTHNYLLHHEDKREILPNDVFHANKKLYVSPFTKMTGRYEFMFTLTKENFKSTILYYEDEKFTLTTYMGGSLKSLTSANILSSLISYPFMTLLVVLRIHWQAVRLYSKKVKHTLRLRPKNYESGRTTLGKDSQTDDTN